MPSSLVVKNGVKSWAATVSEMPSPTSITANSTQRLCALDAARRRRKVSTLSRGVGLNPPACGAPGSSRACMACMPLRERLSNTCSTIVRSHSTASQAWSTSITTRTPSLRACRLTSGMMASSSSRGCTASRTCSRRRTKSCTLFITLPARSACSAMRRIASRRSSASGDGTPSSDGWPAGVAGSCACCKRLSEPAA